MAYLELNDGRSSLFDGQWVGYYHGSFAYFVLIHLPHLLCGRDDVDGSILCAFAKTPSFFLDARKIV